MKAPKSDEYFSLEPENVDPKRLKAERDKARELRKSDWWNKKISAGICHYCGKKFAPKELTMDHIVPLARGGASTKNNVVPACAQCNSSKKLRTPVDEILSQLKQK